MGTGVNAIMLGTGSADVVHAGAGGNTVTLTAAAASDDTIEGGLTTSDGTGNTLVLTTAGAITASGISSFQTYQLADGGLNTLTLTNANFARLPGATITVEGGDTGSTIDASGLAAANAVIIRADQGTNMITGGAANNLFYGETSGTSTINGGVGGINTMGISGHQVQLHSHGRWTCHHGRRPEHRGYADEYPEYQVFARRPPAISP